MRGFSRVILLMSCLFVVSFFLLTCAKKEEGKVLVTEKEFFITHDDKYSWSLHVRGKVKNVGSVDVKNIIITGYCRSCNEIVVNDNWFVNSIERMPEQKDTISYINTGDEVEFKFKEIAYYFGRSGRDPQNTPDQLEIVIESFETVSD